VHVITAPDQFNVDDLFIDLTDLAGARLLLKCEGFNFAGSIKIKAARSMIDDAEREGLIGPGSTLVESSSGNLGVAAALISVSRGYRFICVTDSRCTAGAMTLMRALGAEVDVITRPHPVEGMLGARLQHVRELCAENAGVFWLNQYANPNNWGAHYRSTGPQILRAVPEVDTVFIGAGTTGTLTGCARYLREAKPSVRVVAVDSVGSVTFGGPPSTRWIPGLGSGVPPAQLDMSVIDDVVMVEETDTVRTCWELARRGFLFGGSTGTVVSGAAQWIAACSGRAPVSAVAIAPDLGDRYLGTLYEPHWVWTTYGDDVLPAHADDTVVDALKAGAPL
jgi:N-(2-amino-2-carboxyethyl)-L-glutamate synthase